MSTHKLYTPQGSFRSFATLVCAEFNFINVEVVTTSLEQAIASKSVTGKLPFLETPPNGKIIFSSHSMARYFAGIRRDTGLLGRTYQEEQSVNMWSDWCLQELELPACILFYPVVGYMAKDDEANAKAKMDLADALKTLDDHLKTSKYLAANDHLTLADIIITCALIYPFKLICDETYLKPFENVVRWFQDCVSQPQFVAVVGKVKILGSEN